MTSTLKNLADVFLSKRCPKCKRHGVKRETIPHDGQALWDIREYCTMCKWDTEHENVRV